MTNSNKDILETLARDLYLNNVEEIKFLSVIKELGSDFSSLGNKYPKLWQVKQISELLVEIHKDLHDLIDKDSKIIRNISEVDMDFNLPRRKKDILDLITKHIIEERKLHEQIERIEKLAQSISHKEISSNLNNLISILSKMEYCLFNSLEKQKIDILALEQIENHAIMSIVYEFKKPSTGFRKPQEGAVETAQRILNHIRRSGLGLDNFHFGATGHSKSGKIFELNIIHTFSIGKLADVQPIIITSQRCKYNSKEYRFYYQLGVALESLGVNISDEFRKVYRKHEGNKPN